MTAPSYRCNVGEHCNPSIIGKAKISSTSVTGMLDTSCVPFLARESRVTLLTRGLRNQNELGFFSGEIDILEEELELEILRRYRKDSMISESTLQI